MTLSQKRAKPLLSKFFSENKLIISIMRLVRFLSPQRSRFWFHKLFVTGYRIHLAVILKKSSLFSGRRLKFLTRPQFFSRSLFLRLNQIRKFQVFFQINSWSSGSYFLQSDLNNINGELLNSVNTLSKSDRFALKLALKLIHYPNTLFQFLAWRPYTSSLLSSNRPQIALKQGLYSGSLWGESRFSYMLKSVGFKMTQAGFGLDASGVNNLAHTNKSTTSELSNEQFINSLAEIPAEVLSNPVITREISLVHRTYSDLLNNLLLSKHVVFNKSHSYEMYHDLILNFKQHKLSLILTDHLKKRNHFVLETGMLLKYMEGKKKSAKKSLSTKLVLMRFLRKLLLISGLSSFEIIVKGVPLFLPRLIRFLKAPLPSVINDPVTGQTIDETGERVAQFKFNTLIFVRPKPFGFQKTRKRGRIKRKIRRKIISKARVIDEA